MQNRFASIQTENDTVIILSESCELDAYDVLYQRWTFEGILADSIIFAEADLNCMNNENLELIARRSPLVEPKSKIIIRRNIDGYAFVNFNFEIVDFVD